MKKIVLLASGGDAPGMNACIEAIYRNANAQGIQLYAALNGFDGLVDEKFVQISPYMVRGISTKSGCTFKCGRSKRVMEKIGFSAAIATIKKNKFDVLIVLGGNGSIIGAGRFRSAGINTLFIPATIDNDIEYTKHALGFSSACEGAVKMIDMLKATMGTTGRDHIVQLMGRSSNQLTNRVGTATFADVIDMNGARYTPEQVAKIFCDNRKAGRTSSFCITQERIGGEQIKEMMNGFDFTQKIRDAAKDQSICFSSLGYLQRGAEPSCYDRFLAALYGATAVDCIQKNQFGTCISAVNDAPVLVDLPYAPIP